MFLLYLTCLAEEEQEKREELELKSKRTFKANPYKTNSPPAIALPKRRVKPQPFNSETLYNDPREKIEHLAEQLAAEQIVPPFKAKGMPIYNEFHVERPQTVIVPEPFDLQSVRRAKQHLQQMEEQRHCQEEEEKKERRRRNKKLPLSELTNNPNFDPNSTVLKKELSIQRVST